MLQWNGFGGRLDDQFAVFNLFIIGGIDNVFTNCSCFFRLHLFFVDRLFGISQDTLFGLLEGLFDDIHQIQFAIRQGTFEIISDVRTDGAGTDNRDFMRQGSGGLN